jgi:hypothetical protein
MKSLITLPYEVLANIVSNVDFDDIVSLGKTCKAFEFLYTEESICKSIVQVRDRRFLYNAIKYQILNLLTWTLDKDSFL